MRESKFAALPSGNNVELIRFIRLMKVIGVLGSFEIVIRVIT